MATQNVALPEELMAQAQPEADAQGKTVDDFVIDAVQRQLTDMWLARMQREAEERSKGMTEEEIEEIVLRAVREVREQARKEKESSKR